MDRRRDRGERGERLPAGGEQNRRRAAHAGADDGDLLDAMFRDGLVRRADVLGLAAVGDVLEHAFGFAGAREVEAERQRAAAGELTAQQDELLALLARSHAVTENRRGFGLLLRMMDDAAKPLPATVAEFDALLGRHPDFVTGLGRELNGYRLSHMLDGFTSKEASRRLLCYNPPQFILGEGCAWRRRRKERRSRSRSGPT